MVDISAAVLFVLSVGPFLILASKLPEPTLTQPRFPVATVGGWGRAGGGRLEVAPSLFGAGEVGLIRLAIAPAADEVDLAALAAQVAAVSGRGAADDLESAFAPIPRKRRNMRNMRNKARFIGISCVDGAATSLNFTRNRRNIGSASCCGRRHPLRPRILGAQHYPLEMIVMLRLLRLLRVYRVRGGKRVRGGR